MNVTKCDLCADKAKLDIRALQEALTRQFYDLALSIRDEITEITNVLPTFEVARTAAFDVRCTKGRRIEHMAVQLTKTAELLNTIQDSEGREIIAVNLLGSDVIKNANDNTCTADKCEMRTKA